MPIYKYLAHIIAGKSINFDHFCKQLYAYGYDDQTILKIFSTEKLSKASYQVTILDTALFAQLQAEFPAQNIHSRLSAAQAGDSHKHRVSQAMIILWSTSQSHPVVVLNDAQGINTPVKLNKQLLIIENQENFIQKDLTLAFVKQQFPNFELDDFDIAHGAGNAICNSLNYAFFQHYTHIACLLDLDIGGLNIFANLASLTQHTQLSFLLPPCASTLLPQSKINLQQEQLPELRRLLDNCPALRPAIELIVNSGKMLEQEMYLQV